MPEIVPNWHPAAAHFPIALAVSAVLLLGVGRAFPARAGFASSCGRLLIHMAAIGAVVAAAFGVQAFQTVEHDAAGHLVMLSHRRWALGSAGLLMMLSIWDLFRVRQGRASHWLLIPGAAMVAGGFAYTGWLGGEMVYRHGVGVIQASPVEAVAVPEPLSAPSAGEHVHKDGRRHRH